MIYLIYFTEVGSFNEAAKKLRNSGWSDEIKDFVIKSKPFLEFV